MAEGREALRWALFDGVYYAALLIDSSAAPVEVEDGHSFVYFLDGESGSVIPNSDILPYDPTDKEKASNPLAVTGVEMANKIFYGNDKIENEIHILDAEAESQEEKRIEKKSKSKKHHEKEKTRAESKSNLNKPSVGSKKGELNAAQDWAQLEEDAGLDEDDYLISTSQVNSMLADPAQASEPSSQYTRKPNRLERYGDSQIAMRMRNSSVAQYLDQVKYHYRKKYEEASSTGNLLSAYELDVVQAVERELNRARMYIAYLRQKLDNIEEVYDAFLAMQGVKFSDEERAKRIHSEKENLARRIEALSKPIDVEKIVSEIVRIVPPPNYKRQKQKAAREYKFIDASLAHLCTGSSVEPVPRELSQQILERYLEQKERAQKLASRFSDMNKMGVIEPPKIMEEWNASREALTSANVTDNLSLQPPGVIVKNYSQALRNSMLRSSKATSGNGVNNGGDMLNSRPDFVPLASASSQNAMYPSQNRSGKQTIPAYYNFHEFDLDTRQNADISENFYPRGNKQTNRGFSQDPENEYEDPNDANRPFEQPDLSPIRVDFDYKNLFTFDPNGREVKELLLDQMRDDSQMYSASVNLPNLDSYKYAELQDEPRSLMDRSSRASSVSAFSSAGYLDNDGSVIPRRSSRRNRKARSEGRASASVASGGDWRGSAKRAILEQLTLYLYGKKGKPAVLTMEDFKAIGKNLIDRAVRLESERRGVSMSLQANNALIPFTKETAAKLKKSVDSYVEQHYKTLAERLAASKQNHPGERSEPTGGESLKLHNTTHGKGSGDSPVYQ